MEPRSWWDTKGQHLSLLSGTAGVVSIVRLQFLSGHKRSTISDGLCLLSWVFVASRPVLASPQQGYPCRLPFSVSLGNWLLVGLANVRWMEGGRNTKPVYSSYLFMWLCLLHNTRSFLPWPHQTDPWVWECQWLFAVVWEFIYYLHD